MSPQQLGLIVGGLLPAIFYGTSSVFAKTSSNAGMSVGGYLFFIGIAVSLTGVLFNVALPGTVPSVAAAISSSMQGVLWALGTGCVVLGLLKYQAVGEAGAALQHEHADYGRLSANYLCGVARR